MAFPGTRQFLSSEDPGFNLGMNANAFGNLGMANLANIQNEGLMSLPGANTTVANQRVADELVNQAAALTKTTVPTVPATEIPGAREVFDSGKTTTQALSQDLPGQLYGFDTTGFRSGASLEDVYEQFLKRQGDVKGLQHWSEKIGPTVETDELAMFLQAAQPELQRVSALQPTPDVVNVKDLYEQALGRTNVSPEELAFWTKEFGRSISPAEVERFLAAAKPELETSKYTPFSETVDTTAYPKFEGTAYNPRAYENIVNELSQQQKAIQEKTGFTYGSTFGGAQETIQDLAKRMASMGLTTIYDLGMKHELPVEKVYETIEQDEGAPLQFDTGKYRTISAFKGYDNERNPIFEYRELTPNEVKKLRFDEEGFGFLPIGRGTQEELMNTPYATTRYYNKKTGEEIDTRKFGSKAESGIFASSGAGEGYTNYRVIYGKDGTPIFVPEKELSGLKEFVAEDLSGILSVLRFIPGAQIPVMLAQAAAGAYMGADPKDILKNMATSYIASNLGDITSDVMGKFGVSMPTTDLGKLAMQGGLGALSTLIQGGDLEKALASGALSAVGSGISSLLPKGDGTFNYEKIIQALAPAVARGELSNADVFRLISSLVPSDESKKKKGPGKP